MENWTDVKALEEQLQNIHIVLATYHLTVKNLLEIQGNDVDEVARLINTTNRGIRRLERKVKTIEKQLGK